MITLSDIQKNLRDVDLSGTPICLHSSLRSFGWVEGGAPSVVEAFLLEECTLLVPAFTTHYIVDPPAHLQFPRNGVNYETQKFSKEGTDLVFDPATSKEIGRNLGAISAAVLHRSDSQRGNHPVSSFAGAGPLVETLLKDQNPDDVYSPLEALAFHGGSIVLAGVDLNRMTLIHLSEKKAGRTLFRRWTNAPNGQIIPVEVGGHGGGFPKLEAVLSPFLRKTTVGQSKWKIYPASNAIEATTQAIKEDPFITHCDDTTCQRCNDATAGGPILK
ncbi:MAG: AAC(3) family N-acetyltransferase [bacterium]|nr:AAC(3) family N-acetyltransferase [bacterium]